MSRLSRTQSGVLAAWCLIVTARADWLLWPIDPWVTPGITFSGIVAFIVLTAETLRGRSLGEWLA